MNINQNMNKIMYNNMNIIPNMYFNTNMNIMPNINNDGNFFPNMNMVPNMNYNINIMQQQMLQQMQQQHMNFMNFCEEERKKFEEEERRKKEEDKQRKKIEEIKNYFDSKLYEIDFRRIKGQNESFKQLKKKLMNLTNQYKILEECIQHNNKIMNDYLREPNDKINYNTLLQLSSTIEDIYEDKLKEFELCVNEIKKIYNSAVEELKNNYLIDINKKFNFDIEDKNYVGFRNTGLLNVGKLDEVKFKELCRINFKNISELELKFQDDIDISVLTKATYHNLTFLGLNGKIKDIIILSKLPFKYLNKLFLSNNNFYNT